MSCFRFCIQFHANIINARVQNLLISNDLIRSFLFGNNHENQKNKMIIPLMTSNNQIDGYQTIRRTYHTTLKTTPQQLDFSKDLIKNISLKENGDKIQKNNGATKNARNPP
jgi:hypothetical protein